jgi:hypothetical protein
VNKNPLTTAGCESAENLLFPSLAILAIPHSTLSFQIFRLETMQPANNEPSSRSISETADVDSANVDWDAPPPYQTEDTGKAVKTTAKVNGMYHSGWKDNKTYSFTPYPESGRIDIAIDAKESYTKVDLPPLPEPADEPLPNLYTSSLPRLNLVIQIVGSRGIFIPSEGAA